MANNPIIRGFNAIGKIIGRGFASDIPIGRRVKICRVWTEPYTCQKVSTS